MRSVNGPAAALGLILAFQLALSVYVHDIHLVIKEEHYIRPFLDHGCHLL